MSAAVEAKGDCFSAAADLIISLDLTDARLVHGMVTGTGEIKGLRHPHAWVEMNNLVLDYSNGSEVVCDRPMYYEAGEIEPLKKCEYRTYSFDEMMELLIDKLHYGPWHVGVKK